ncbi:MAG TPA: hypothetical protein VNC39_07595 [Acidocella sp.]|jgi:hypothetical protein|uniref:hypothetical protein n=1 Tax=Acidocella sp. TaxID=50710 RepID=UPI002C4E42E1|nr:hypothetical protein [Acidocella sp.]HVE21822.1 hypothetical protein [Acidocella sp.]
MPLPRSARGAPLGRAGTPMRRVTDMPDDARNAVPARAGRPEWLGLLAQVAPDVARLLAPPAPPALDPQKTLRERRTEDLIALLDDGWFLADIARLWGCGRSGLNAWIARDNERAARARLSRKQVSDLWAKAGMQMLVWAASDKNELKRATEIANYCKWMASKFDPDSYGARVAVQNEDERTARELTTAELMIIANGGSLKAKA